MISSHLPHSDYSDLEYEAALAALEDVLPNNLRNHFCVIGCDANAVIGSQQEQDNVQIVGRHGLGVRNYR